MTEVSEDSKQKKKREIKFEDTMNKFFTQWMKTINLEIQKQLSNPNHTIMRKLKPKNILNKRLKR